MFKSLVVMYIVHLDDFVVNGEYGGATGPPVAAAHPEHFGRELLLSVAMPVEAVLANLDGDCATVVRYEPDSWKRSSFSQLRTRYRFNLLG